MDRQKLPARHVHIGRTLHATQQVVEALDAFCAAESVPDEVAWQFRVALDEIVANFVSHAHAPHSGVASAPSLDLWFRREQGAVEVTVADNGPAFNPLLHPDPDVTLPLSARKPGGLGITLVKSLMDDVRYERTDRNVLTIRKQLGTVAGPLTGKR